MARVPTLTLLTVQLLDATQNAAAELGAQIPSSTKIAPERRLLNACRELQAAIQVRRKLGGLVSVPTPEVTKIEESTQAQAALLDTIRRLQGGSTQSSSSTPPPAPPSPPFVDG